MAIKAGTSKLRAARAGRLHGAPSCVSETHVRSCLRPLMAAAVRG